MESEDDSDSVSTVVELAVTVARSDSVGELVWDRNMNLVGERVGETLGDRDCDLLGDREGDLIGIRDED